MKIFPNIQSRLTPVNRDYDNCDDVYVFFTVYCDFNKIKKKFHPTFIPDKDVRKGEILTNSRGKKWVVPNDLWVISSDKKIISKDARDHLDYVLNIIYPEKENILALQSQCRMSLKCVWFAKGISGGPAIWPEQMNLISGLNLELSFSFYPADW
ncbi:DUF4279 domain-containing protein [Eikenella corrodens]|uniref:DUF4279 domain-containing protein n=1 Tax=Eikenella corrodens TaxID=539 RepID=A0A3S9SJ96_EIKCO|nr:DUF4279 domain-containing protein [Eikenella corrodens]AZR59518.1 DUF4279 domain-containing protein [Eikenella corrodens]